MRKTSTTYELSASDLVGHLACRHLTELNRAVADGLRERPPIFSDPALEARMERGLRHEAAYVQHCAADGEIVDLGPLQHVGVTDETLSGTLDAMRRGATLIVQAALKSGVWGGRPDILRRIDKPSALGPWSYEALDTKLAREPAGGAVLQLCLYSELLGAVQGHIPEQVYVVTPGEPFTEHAFRIDDFAAYYRRVKSELERSLATPPAETYPDPALHCDICRWAATCEAQRRRDDHLSFIAGMGKAQTTELVELGLSTLSLFAATDLPATWRPSRGAKDTFDGLQEQARIQRRGRAEQKPIYELLPVVEGMGLAQLPTPSPGDIFLDLEGDHFVPPNGREYLFGYVTSDRSGRIEYGSHWAITAEDEKNAFEATMDFISARLTQFPDAHVYHYAPYEPSAFKRLMGRYATREQELDGFLRSSRFVDLYAVVRRSMRCSVESYSIKRLEEFYGFTREIELRHVNLAIGKVQSALELGSPLEALQGECDIVESYNRDDCISTLRLRDWLETLRAGQETAGIDIPRPVAKPAEPPEELGERERAAAALGDRLSAGAPVDAVERTVDQQARWLLAQLLQWHRREEKASSWEYFRLAELSGDELSGERAALSGLTFDSVTTEGRAPVHRYRFPPQETDLRGGEKLHLAGGEKLGSLADISLDEGWIDIKKREDSADVHPTEVFGFDNVRTHGLAAALMRIGEDVAERGLGDTVYTAARALLRRETPAKPGVALKSETEDHLSAGIRLCLSLKAGVLPIQGPPGAGKTFTGAHMIKALVAAGKRVGVTANSHKVIAHLLDESLKLAEAEGIVMSGVQKVREAAPARGALSFMTSNTKALAAIGVDAVVLGATAWLWSRPDAMNSVDVLFVDEAAQMSLANVLAVSHAAPLLVLLGDPRQLEQPMKGSHPEGTDVSALDHILGGKKTIAPDQGLFLEETWRLHPEICAFTSELFYEGRLRSRPELQAQALSPPHALAGSGLRYMPVKHSGNQNVSREEVEAVGRLVEETLASGMRWTDRHGADHDLTIDDVLIVAPYNAQVYELRRRLPTARVGTVDKFQGQEAPLVIYSMTTSDSTSAPRGMEFLFSLNRLNVATSRAKCVCVLVASPQLFEAQCQSPRQMQLANALCRYRELALPA